MELTRVVRGSEPAPPDQITTTPRGPWVVTTLTIDLDRARGHLEATYGPHLAPVERTTDLVRSAGALAGVNASFFAHSASPEHPGDPVGLGLYDGALLSEPTTDRAEADLVVDSRSDRVLIGRTAWSGAVRNRQSDDTLPLDHLDHPPVVPPACAELPDQTQCDHPGDVVLFHPEFGPTPSGHGTEVVLDQRGCVVRTSATRRTTLEPHQTSLQATGRDAAALLSTTENGCLDRISTLTDDDGDRILVRPGVFGVNGRYRLVADGEVVVPPGSGDFFARNPRTIAGTTAEGRIVLATVDGRRPTSVGTTLDETAALAAALGPDGRGQPRRRSAPRPHRSAAASPTSPAARKNEPSATHSSTSRMRSPLPPRAETHPTSSAGPPRTSPCSCAART
ncbi:phosphodiester glycosidase family protein [Saccharopolyspora rhizosphaerae]|uniref:phosphodiester glycosidase family protein n=1 Tax=Saccharopolyspora rhizosphaerae TaxID=2492662 RepID=UPI0018F3E858|nr:phosphodiester glycosidase family protein [Saccharopolyspora rhizosphaerae]